MCGRTCLTLEPLQIAKACKYKPNISPSTVDDHEIVSGDSKNKVGEDEVYIEPEWRSEYNCGRKYITSYNISPFDVTPVIISSDHFAMENDGKNSQSRRLLIPMMWGMIPFWHKGDYRKHGLTTNNCRLEHMLESKMFSGPFRKGQRCVVLCEGFYEWQTTKTSKPSERAPHFIYMTQKSNVKIYDRKTWQPEDMNLLKMAGLFDVWENDEGDKIYSYSVITFESSQIMSWLHHRMPAILETEQQINDWLDYKHISDKDALSALRPAVNLQFYPVGKLVNNSRNKVEQCNIPLEFMEIKKPKMNGIMSAWLNTRKRKETEIATTLSNKDGESLHQELCTDTSSASESETQLRKRPRLHSPCNALQKDALNTNILTKNQK